MNCLRFCVPCNAREKQSLLSRTSFKKSWLSRTRVTVMRRGKLVGMVATKETSREELANMMVGR
jgi:simple sugar transport system ATP-binding protein